MAKSSKRGIHCRDESAAGSVVSLAVLLPIADRRIRFSASTNARRFASICECLVSSDMLRSRIWTCCLANSRERLAESRFLSIRSIFFTSPSPVPAVACRKAVPGLIASGPFIGSLRWFDSLVARRSTGRCWDTRGGSRAHKYQVVASNGRRDAALRSLAVPGAWRIKRWASLEEF